MKRPKKPVVILASANSESDPLPSLNEEADTVQQILHEVEDETGLQTVFFPRLSLSQLVDTVTQKDWDVYIFHFAGHADGDTLKLTDGELAFGRLGSVLSEQLGTKIVFLNGCGTIGMVRALAAAGIPGIIATKSKIDDNKAALFSEFFYSALSKGSTFKQSFEIASSLLAARFPDENLGFQISRPSRSLNIGFDKINDHNHWELIVSPGRRKILKWTLFTEQKRRRQLKLLTYAFGMLLLLILQFFALKGFLYQTTTVEIHIRDKGGNIPSFQLAPGYHLVYEKSGGRDSISINGWNTELKFQFFRWDHPIWKIWISKNGLACSNPQGILEPTRTQEYTFNVNPIYGRLISASAAQNMTDTLALKAQAPIGSYEETFPVYPPQYHVASLMSYKYSSQMKFVHLSLKGEEFTLSNFCEWVPPTAKTHHEYQGFKCIILSP